ncbi:AMP-binding protein [Streptomyces lavendulae]|uniref:AMP-binding protein n=1 Tax=Streptomyces lavendulae TaxID=1914 RepID=UPI002552E086|nr:AMP-binding protein [Streptomyces lavendulae]
MSQTEAAEAARLALTRPLALDLTTTLVGHLARHAAATPDTVFIHHGPRTTTYGRLLEQVAQVRGELLAAGCRPGDVVACAGPRSARTLALFLALESIAAVYLPLGPDWPAQRTASVLRRSAADLVADYLGEDAADARHAPPSTRCWPSATAGARSNASSAWPTAPSSGWRTPRGRKTCSRDSGRTAGPSLTTSSRT